MNTRTLVVERVFPHAPEKLWRALTESTLLAQWLMSNDFSPSVGHKFQFRTEPVRNWNGIIDCEITAVEPLKQLAYSWSSLGLETVVLFTLTPSEGGTHLRMEQSGFPMDAQASYQGANYGWQKFFNGLEHVLDGLEQELAGGVA